MVALEVAFMAALVAVEYQEELSTASTEPIDPPSKLYGNQPPLAT